MHNKGDRKMSSLMVPLREYAVNKELTIDAIAEKTGKNYSTILRATRELEEKYHLVKFSREERTSVRGKSKKYYTLIVYGLEWFLADSLKHDRIKGSWTEGTQEIREIAQAHADMLLSFRKWTKFIESKCEETVLANLKESVSSSILTRYQFMPLFSGMVLTPDQEAGSKKALDAQTLGLFHVDTPIETVKEAFGQRWEGLLRLWKVVETDYDLRVFRERFLHDLELIETEKLKSIADWRKFLPHAK